MLFFSWCEMKLQQGRAAKTKTTRDSLSSAINISNGCLPSLYCGFWWSVIVLSHRLTAFHIDIFPISMKCRVDHKYCIHHNWVAWELSRSYEQIIFCDNSTSLVFVFRQFIFKHKFRMIWDKLSRFHNLYETITSCWNLPKNPFGRKIFYAKAMHVRCHRNYHAKFKFHRLLQLFANLSLWNGLCEWTTLWKSRRSCIIHCTKRLTGLQSATAHAAKGKTNLVQLSIKTERNLHNFYDCYMYVAAMLLFYSEKWQSRL